jgi:hypothetical protein
LPVGVDQPSAGGRLQARTPPGAVSAVYLAARTPGRAGCRRRSAGRRRPRAAAASAPACG